MRSLVGKMLIAVIGAVCATAVQGQQKGVSPTGDDYVLLSDNYGGRTYVGLPVVGRQTPDDPIETFTPKVLSGGEISNLFSQLCLTKMFDRAAYDAARGGAASDFKSITRSLPYFEAAKPLIGVNKVAATQIVQEHAPYGISSLWLGEGGEGLANRQYLRYSGSLIVTGPVKVKDLYAPQCNLTIRVSGLTAVGALLDGLQTAVGGQTAIKRVEKPKYGYATWTTPFEGGRIARIFAEAEGLQKGAQTVHLTVQLLPLGKTK